jgi:hypothetical protein
VDGHGIGDRFLQGQEIFLFPTASRLALRAIQSPIQWVLGYLSHEVKRPGRESDNSIYIEPEVVRGAISTPPYVFMARCTIN